MDLPFDDWADLSASGMKMVAIHLPSGTLGLVILDAGTDLPEGQGTAAHAEALATLHFHRLERQPRNGWYRRVDLWKPGMLYGPGELAVTTIVGALGGNAVRFSRQAHFVDRSHEQEAVREEVRLPPDQPARDLYFRTLNRLSRRIAALKRAGIVPSPHDRGSMADWPDVVFETVGEAPGDELDAIAAALGPGRPGEEPLQRVADFVWRMLTVDDLEDAVQGSYAGIGPVMAYLCTYLPAEMEKQLGRRPRLPGGP